MPRVSIWFVRAALLHLLSGTVLGAAYLTLKAEGWPLWVATHLQVHVEQMLMGWMVQLVMGVGFWVLPRPAGFDARRDGRLMGVVFVLLNAGVLAAGLGTSPALPAPLLLAGRVAETAAAGLFAAHAWQRQRAYRHGIRTVLV